MVALVCSIERCPNEANRKGAKLCEKHYMRKRRTGKPDWYMGHPEWPTLSAAFEYFVRRTEKCWEWAGTKHSNGYGLIPWGGRWVYAHRLAYELFKGQVPEGLDVLHSCDNPPCTKPEHLRAGTHKDNMADMVMRGRASHKRTKWSATHPLRLHPERILRGERHPNARFTPETVRAIRRAGDQGISPTVLSRQYGVSATAISLIIKRKNWGWLPDHPAEATKLGLLKSRWGKHEE